jgi:hypothetical protein
VRLGFVWHGDASGDENTLSHLLYTWSWKYWGHSVGDHQEERPGLPGGSQAQMLAIETPTSPGGSGLAC